jgi:hypothetical protein
MLPGRSGIYSTVRKCLPYFHIVCNIFPFGERPTLAVLPMNSRNLFKKIGFYDLEK